MYYHEIWHFYNTLFRMKILNYSKPRSILNEKRPAVRGVSIRFTIYQKIFNILIAFLHGGFSDGQQLYYYQLRVWIHRILLHSGGLLLYLFSPGMSSLH